MKKILPLLALGLMLGTGPVHPGHPQEAGFPLRKGAFWVYEGLARWTEPGSAAVQEKTVRLTMKVVDVIQRKDVTAASIKGHPQDLVWYDPQDEPGDYLIVRTGKDKFYLLEGERAAGVSARLRDPRDSLSDLVQPEELFLDFPLAPQKRFGSIAPGPRDDAFYAWLVEGEQTPQPNEVKGLVSLQLLSRYRLAFRTLPDHTLVDFVPAVGITRYVYGHHGTVAEVDVKLVEYSP